MVMAGFVAVLMISNIIVSKVVTIFGMSLTGGVFVFPLSYIFGDILTEVYGYRRSRLVIWTGFAALALMSAAFFLVGALPGDAFWVEEGGQKAWDMLLGQTPRIVIASLIAYFAGEFLNSFVLARMKIWTRGRYLWSRTIGSTIVGEGVDTVVFILAAFTGVLPGGLLQRVILGNYVVKVLIEVVMTPITYGAVAHLKRVENEDFYDFNTDFNPFRLELKTGIGSDSSG